MSKEKVSLRVEDSILQAYERADAPSRSAAMREALRRAIVDGDVQVPEQYRELAEIEEIKSQAKLSRRRGRFKEVLYQWFSERWSKGCVTPADVEHALEDSWLKEAKVHENRDDASQNERFAKELMDWYKENWTPSADMRGDFPDPGVFLQRARRPDGDIAVSDTTMKRVRRAYNEGRSESEVRRVLGGKAGVKDEQLNEAIRRVYDGDDEPEVEA